jgi:NAD-dependent deacetylase
MAKLIILTGAGLSAESGLRTFRDNDGLWENHSVEEICDGRTWRRNFELVHKFYNDRRTGLATAEPNEAHRMIAKWESLYDTIILTQNVDDLLERAGCKKVVHLHGFLPEMTCAMCESIWNIGYTTWKSDTPCPTCKSLGEARPRIVFFGEAAPHYRTLWDSLDSLSDRDVLLVIGPSGTVLPISQIAAMYPGFKILNNLGSESAIEDNLFDKVLHIQATQAAKIIDPILNERLETSED